MHPTMLQCSNNIEPIDSVITNPIWGKQGLQRLSFLLAAEQKSRRGHTSIWHYFITTYFGSCETL